MSARIAGHLRGNVVGYVAVFIALSGTAYAVDGPLQGQNKVGSADIINGEVYTEDIGNGQVIGSKLAPDSISSAKIDAGEVKAGDIGQNAVASAEIVNDTVTGTDIFNGSVTSVDIPKGAIQRDDLNFEVKEPLTAIVSPGGQLRGGNASGVQRVQDGDYLRLLWRPRRQWVHGPGDHFQCISQRARQRRDLRGTVHSEPDPRRNLGQHRLRRGAARQVRPRVQLDGPLLGRLSLASENAFRKALPRTTTTKGRPIRSRSHSVLTYLRQQWMGALALFLVLTGGVAYAADTIGSSDVINNSLLSEDIKDNEVKTPDLASSSVQTGKIGNNQVFSANVRDATLPSRGLTAADIAPNAVHRLGGARQHAGGR